ncbi:MAG: rRNA pseudouridine synthase, partial [Anaerolineae bacterium]|nr:rRNA pseudouridine synthase [Anaerolineae bacterium]
MAERLQKLISAAGIASRRDAEALIEQGRVTVNGKRAELGDKADPTVDDVRVDGERIAVSAERVYIMLNKPRQVVTTARSQSQDERETVRDLVPVEGYLYPVGRLDADSEGLVLLTNDGELAERLTHPRYRHAKVYQVTVQGFMADDALDIWRRGVVLDDGKTAPAEVKVVRRESRFTQLQVTMHEGRKRQIRRIGNTLGHPVESIRRTHLATLELGDLEPGEWRYLTDVEVRTLRASALSGPALDEPSRPSAREVRGQRQAARSVPRTGYKRGEPGRRETESRGSRGP